MVLNKYCVVICALAKQAESEALLSYILDGTIHCVRFALPASSPPSQDPADATHVFMGMPFDATQKAAWDARQDLLAQEIWPLTVDGVTVSLEEATDILGDSATYPLQYNMLECTEGPSQTSGPCLANALIGAALQEIVPEP